MAKGKEVAPKGNELKVMTVCVACLRVTCWWGLFYCVEYKSANIMEMPVKKLRKLGLEHPSYWTKDALMRYTGVDLR